MIIHSHDYFLALKKEIEGFRDYVKNQQYGADVVFMNDGISKELDFINTALSMHNCASCMHRKGTLDENGIVIEGSSCAVNGMFNKGFKADSYVCPNWVWDDVPIA